VLDLVKDIKYSVYKSSGVDWIGEIPKHWEIKKLKHLFFEKKKKTNPELNCGSISFGKVVVKDDEKIPLSTKASYQEVLKGDFLINPLNLNYDLISLRIALSEIEVVVSSGYIVLKNSAEINLSYYKWLLHRYDVAYMKLLGSGVRQTINFGDMADSLLVFPPLEEQTRIGQFLDRKTAQIDQAIAQKEKLIELLKERRRILIHNAVTRGLNSNVKMKDSGVEWIEEVPEHWEVKELRYIKKPGTDITYGIVQAGPDLIDGIPYIRTSDMKGNVLPETGYLKTSSRIASSFQRSRVVEGDLVVAIRATLGKGLLVPKYLEGANLTQGTAKISPGAQLNRHFFLLVFNSHYVQTQIDLVAKGTTFREITLDRLQRIKLLLPSIDEQERIVAYLTARNELLDMTIDQLENEIEKLKEYKATLINSAVTGKIKV
jgi:type I restriction enzyme S subunit